MEIGRISQFVKILWDNGSMSKDSHQKEYRERELEHYRKTCVELAKHVGVLSVGLSVVFHGILESNLLDTLQSVFPPVVIVIAMGILSLLMSFCFSVWVIFIQLVPFKSKSNESKRRLANIHASLIISMLLFFGGAAFSGFLSLLYPLLIMIPG